MTFYEDFDIIIIIFIWLSSSNLSACLSRKILKFIINYTRIADIIIIIRF